jgi:hypothetical protein
MSSAHVIEISVSDSRLAKLALTISDPKHYLLNSISGKLHQSCKLKMHQF